MNLGRMVGLAMLANRMQKIGNFRLTDRDKSLKIGTVSAKTGSMVSLNDGDELRSILDFVLVEKRERRQPKMTWKRQVEEDIDLEMKNAIDRKN